MNKKSIKQKKYSPDLVLAYVETADYEDLEKQIKQIEDSLGSGIFYWQNQTLWAKKVFLNKVLTLDFLIRLALLNTKDNVEKQVKLVLPDLLEPKDVYGFYINNKQPSWYEKEVRLALAGKITLPENKDVIANSEHPIVRLADMVAGIAKGHFAGMGDENEGFYKLLEPRVVAIFPHTHGIINS